MKWYHSIITKVTIIFLLALFGVVALFYSLNSYEKKRDIEHTQNLVRALVHDSFKNRKQNFDKQKLFDAGFKPIEDKELRKRLLLEIDKNQHTPKRGRGMALKAFGYKQNIYVHMRIPMQKESLLLQSPLQRSPFPRAIFPLLAFGLLTLLYVAIIRSILPLYSLRKRVKEFAEGKEDIECASNKRDEIAALANEFDKSVKKITKLRESRGLFLRNVMHELKTPITKGKLACELIENSNYKESLQNVFRRQENLLEEFSRIEKLSANELQMQKSSYNIEDIIDFALDILAQDSMHVQKKIEQNFDILVDFELFATALKNLLDNGINYSDDKQVLLHVRSKTITVSNKGAALEFPLYKYAEPYFMGGTKQQSSRGLGFGLYITWHIIKAHGFEFDYKREEETNKFTITF